MSGKKIILYLLTAFITGTLILVYIQYNSSKNIDVLVTGNERLLNELQIQKNLAAVENGIVIIQRNLKGAIASGGKSYITTEKKDIAEIQKARNSLQAVSDDTSTAKLIDSLDDFVELKIKLCKKISRAFSENGKLAAEDTINANMETLVSNSIEFTVRKIDSTRTSHLTDVTLAVDKSEKKAQQFSYLLVALVLLAAGLLFWYIIYIIQKLIQSEKKVKETARVKENFMANMSHEIRTPMNAILGFTNLLQRQSLNEKSKEYVQTIQKSGENLLKLINDILDLSKIEAGMMRIESAPFNIRALTHSVQTMFADKAKEKGIGISTTVDDTVPDILEGDATRLTQVLINLIGNALKFTKEGSVIIEVKGGMQTGNTLNTVIRVADTGIGIEKEKINEVFSRFQQADDAVTRKYGGSGLGLSIVKEIVLLQNGAIHAESAPGKGTVFTVSIPYKITHAGVSKSTAALQHHHHFTNNFENIKVLVAEDNEINQSLLKHLFAEWALQFDLAANGKEAVELLLTNQYNLVLMDIQMPIMDGYTTAKEIRERLRSDVPIIAMTAHALAGEREKCLSYGMNEYISKPIHEEELYQLISQYISVNKKETATALSLIASTHQYINLNYMKEISMGNTEYEETVTKQFIETVPEDISNLKKYWQQTDIPALKQTAHNMKTTISVMGLTEILQPFLDALEYETPDEESFQKKISHIESICLAALKEAKEFYNTFLKNIPAG